MMAKQWLAVILVFTEFKDYSKGQQCDGIFLQRDLTCLATQSQSICAFEHEPRKQGMGRLAIFLVTMTNQMSKMKSFSSWI